MWKMEKHFSFIYPAAKVIIKRSTNIHRSIQRCERLKVVSRSLVYLRSCLFNFYYWLSNTFHSSILHLVAISSSHVSQTEIERDARERRTCDSRQFFDNHSLALCRVLMNSIFSINYMRVD